MSSNATATKGSKSISKMNRANFLSRSIYLTSELAGSYIPSPALPAAIKTLPSCVAITSRQSYPSSDLFLTSELFDKNLFNVPSKSKWPSFKSLSNRRITPKLRLYLKFNLVLPTKSATISCGEPLWNLLLRVLSFFAK